MTNDSQPRAETNQSISPITILKTMQKHKVINATFIVLN